MEREDDVQLIQRTLSGDEAAFGILLQRYQKSVHALVWRKIGDFHTAEDITQDTFLQAYKKLSTLKNHNQFAGWLYVIANRLCIDWSRKKRFTTQSLEDTPVAEIDISSYTHHVSEQRETERTERRRELVKELLAQLPESERTVVTLYYLGEMTTKEIGKFLGVSIDTIKSRLRRGRKRLQKDQALMIQEVLGGVQIPASLYENVMRQVADMKFTSSPVSKPFLHGTDEFTVEAWVYPTTPPDKDTAGMILHQQVRMLIVNDEFQPFLNNLANALNIEHPKGDLILLMSAYIEGKLGRRLPFPIPLEPNQWHHIAYQSKGPQTTMIVNDFVTTIQQDLPLGHDASLPLDFVLGGFGKIIRMPVKEKQFYDSFTGYIDEVRISTVARYDVEKKGFMPDDKFKNDAKTVALWHFDERSGTREFSDASGNEYHLKGIGGAETGIPLAVEAEGKLTITWGRLKQ